MIEHGSHASLNRTACITVWHALISEARRREDCVTSAYTYTITHKTRETQRQQSMHTKQFGAHCDRIPGAHYRYSSTSVPVACLEHMHSYRYWGRRARRSERNTSADAPIQTHPPAFSALVHATEMREGFGTHRCITTARACTDTHAYTRTRA